MKERLDGLAAWLHDLPPLPKPTRAQLLKGVPVLAIVVVLLVLIGRNYDTVDFPNYSVPEGYVPRPPPTTRPPGGALPVLAAVPGTTVREVPPNVGGAFLSGTVSGPNGPVAGAIVRIERSIMGVTQTSEVGTTETGGWSAAGLGGGRYRVRAFLPPFLASRTAEVFLLPANDSRTVDLTVEEFNQPSVSIASAPVPAFLDDPVNVAVRVTGRFVDADGFVGVQPLAGAVVDVQAPPGWQRTAPLGTLVTDGDGMAIATFVCRQVGSVQVTATVRTTAGGSPLQAQATLECVDPATLTTTTQPGDGVTPVSTTTTTVVDGTTTTEP